MSISLRAYKNKLEEWGFIKYNPRRKRPETSPLDLAQNLDFAQTTEAASALVHSPFFQVNLTHSVI